MTALLLFGSLAVLVVAGMPVAFALLVVSAGYFLFSPVSSQTMVQQLIGGIDSFPLLAVAFFVFLGTIMARGGIAERLLGFVESLVGHWRGGLAQVNVFNSVLMGGMCGSANADAAIDSKILVPVMEKRGYPKAFSASLSAASGVIAPILPPGIGVIIYGLLANVSIGHLFVGSIVPALLLAVGLSAVVAVVSRRRGYGAMRDRRAPLREIVRLGVGAAWALAMPVILLVGLRMGVFTPTELGAIAVLYALFVAFVVYRGVRPKDIGSVTVEATTTTASIMLIIAAASVFGWIMTIERIPQSLVELLLGISTEPWVVLLVLNVAILVIGMVIESNSLLIILTPMLAPVAMQLGIDPVHFGVVLVLNLTIGSMTPPIGTVLYTVCSITNCSVGAYTRESVKFIGAMLAVLAVTTYVPLSVTYLPSIFFD